MKSINYNVPRIKQGFQDCAQASVVQVLNYYGIKKTVADVKKEVPVYVSKKGLTLGSSIGHIATYLLRLGFKATMHIVDIEIFDRSWANFSKEKLIKSLRQRKKFIRHPKYDKDTINVIVEGYIEFLKNGGNIKFPIIDKQYLLELLEKGPVIAIVSSNFFYSMPKTRFDKSGKKIIKDSIKGSSATHVVVISGHKADKFKIVDPAPKLGGIKWYKTGHLLGSIYLAETDFDSLLISLEKRA